MRDVDLLRRLHGGVPARGLPFAPTLRAAGALPESAPPGAVANYLPVDIHPPGDATPFQAAGVLATASATFVEVARVQLPASSPGVIRQLELTVAGNITAATDARWRIEVGGQVAPGWVDVPATPAVAAATTLTVDEHLYLRLPPGALVILMARAADGINYTFTARALGWSWGNG